MNKNSKHPLENLFESFISQEVAGATTVVKRNQTFEVDVIDRITAYEIIADLPGIDKDNISIKYRNGYLIIEATRLIGNFDHTYIKRERTAGKMSRSFKINNINFEKMSTFFINGVLKLSLPKKGY